MEAIGVQQMRAEVSAMLPREDLTSTSVRELRTKLETALGLAAGDLEPRKAEVHAVIQEEVIRFLQPSAGAEADSQEDDKNEVDEEERERRRKERKAARQARREARQHRRMNVGMSRREKLAAQQAILEGKPPPPTKRKSGGFARKGRFAGKAVLKKPEVAKATRAPVAKKPQGPKGPKERKLEAIPEALRQELWDKWLALHGDAPLTDLPDLPSVWGYEELAPEANGSAEVAVVEETLCAMDVDADSKTNPSRMANLASPMRTRAPDPMKVLSFEDEAVSQ